MQLMIPIFMILIICGFLTWEIIKIKKELAKLKEELARIQAEIFYKK